MIPNVADFRYTVLETRKAAGRDAFVADVQRGLQANAKFLPCQYIYDARGSELFEQICALPEYYPPRAEREIIERHADAIVDSCDLPCDLVELGSGSAEKTGPLIAALGQRQQSVHYHPIDVSRTALEDSARRMFGDYERLTIRALVGDYDSALQQLPASGEARLFAWLGSSIGNLDRRQAAAFLSRLPLRARDRAFIGIDLRKDRATLLRAYDDEKGLTAKFISNILVRINRELYGDFDLDKFEYRARYDADEGCVTMAMVSTCDQVVQVGALRMRVALRAGEAIHVENSYKYSEEETSELAARAGLVVERRFFDSARRFCDVLLAPAR